MRHKWTKEINHFACHKYICVNGCGCVKDATAMTNTVYWLNGEKLFNAPECKPKERLPEPPTENSITKTT